MLVAAALARAASEAPLPDEDVEPPPLGSINPPVLAATPPFAYPGAWEYRFGDSPRAADGRPLWALPSSRSAEWEDLRPLRELPGDKDGRFLWLRTQLPKHGLVDPVLFIYSIDQLVEAYVDGELVYRFGEFDGPRALRFPGSRSLFVPLRPPREAAPRRRLSFGQGPGHLLALRIHSSARIAGIAGIPRLAERSQLVQQIFVEDLGRIVVGWMMLLLGAGGLCLFLLRRQERSYLAYACFALATGTYTLTQLQVRDLVYEAPLLWTHVELGSLHLVALFLCWFIEVMFGRGPLGVMRWLRRLHTVQVVIAAVLVGSAVIPLFATLPPLQVVILVDVLAATMTVLVAAWRGNVEARIFAVGLMVAAGLAMHDVLASMNVILRSDASWSQYANGALMLALAVVLGRRFELVHKRLRDYTQVLQTSLASTRVLVPDERAQVALEQMVQMFGARRALLFLVDEATDRIELRGGRDEVGHPIDSADDFEQGVVEEVRARGRALVREGLRASPSRSQSGVGISSGRRGRRSVLAAPLQFRGALLGVLLVERGRGGTEEEGLDLLLGLANQVAIVVASSRAMQAEVESAMTKQRFNEQRGLLDAAVRMASGDLSTPIIAPVGSPIAHLAESLEAMRQDVWAKILQLETKNREVEMLNVELRRQIAQRSRRLIGAILRQQGGKPAPLPDLSPGQIVVGRYRVNKTLGQGAMGVVLEVERVADGRRLAAKFVSQRADKQSLLRFVREAQILARLSHPNLISIFDVDMTAGGVLFMVMELVIGSPLDALHKRYGQLPWALCVLRQIAEALSAIHAAGIVHRDLKPANVLVAGGDAQPLPVVKLADFGVSLLLPSMLPGREPPRSSQSLGPMSAASLGGAAAADDDDELDDVDPTRSLDASAMDSIIPTLGGHTTLGGSTFSGTSGPGVWAQGTSRPPQRNPERQEARTVMLGAPAPLPPSPSMSPPPLSPPPGDPAADPWEPPTISLRPGPGGLRPAMEEPSLGGLDPPTLTLKPPQGESRPPSSVSLPGPPRMPLLQPMSLNKNGPILDSLAAEPSEMMFGGPLGASEVTQSGILIGTPMYMAPENWAHGSHHAEPSSDLFSLGVMAFELLTGQLPFLTPPIHARARDEEVHIMRLREARASIDPVLCELVDRCLSLEPEARPSAAEVAQKLLELGAQRPPV